VQARPIAVQDVRISYRMLIIVAAAGMPVAGLHLDVAAARAMILIPMTVIAATAAQIAAGQDVQEDLVMWLAVQGTAIVRGGNVAVEDPV
jgi:hypothetical protein